MPQLRERTGLYASRFSIDSTRTLTYTSSLDDGSTDRTRLVMESFSHEKIILENRLRVESPTDIYENVAYADKSCWKRHVLQVDEALWVDHDVELITPDTLKRMRSMPGHLIDLWSTTTWLGGYTPSTSVNLLRKPAVLDSRLNYWPRNRAYPGEGREAHWRRHAIQVRHGETRILLHVGDKLAVHPPSRPHARSAVEAPTHRRGLFGNRSNISPSISYTCRYANIE